MNGERPVNKAARQALALGAGLVIVLAFAFFVIYLHGHPPGT